ncbi:hypothetical protein H8958_007295 [Nasalis larvatus]
MRLRERSLRQDPDLRQELASLARGCDFVLPSRFKKRLKAFQQVQTRKEEPLPPATSQSIPTFYFPRGRPQDSLNVDAVISKIESTFARFPHERATMDDMGLVAKACGCPLYWKGPLFYGAGGERTGSVSVHKFVAMWRKILQNCHDDAAKFVHLLMSPGCNYLVQEDLVPFLQDVVNTHPGLSFLKEASEFHSRYITTVIQRIFYTVNRSWSGRITCAELRRSSFLQNVALLEEEADINQLTEFFSYEHFYVIYCKFWELDTDHDLLIDAHDLARHNDHAISTKMIDRIFSGAVTRGRKVQKEGKISYADFVWFLISEEDKKTPTRWVPAAVWMCSGAGPGAARVTVPGTPSGPCLRGELRVLSFQIQGRLPGTCTTSQSLRPWGIAHTRPEGEAGLTPWTRPVPAGKITLQDLKRCKLASVFFDTFFNIEKYLDHEQKEQISLLRDSDSSGPELSDWEKVRWGVGTPGTVRGCGAGPDTGDAGCSSGPRGARRWAVGGVLERPLPREPSWSCRILSRERVAGSAAAAQGRLRGRSCAGGWSPGGLRFPETTALAPRPGSAPPAPSSPSPRCRFEAELSPVEQKLSALRSPLAQRPFFEAPAPLGAVDLYEYARGDEDLEPL